MMVNKSECSKRPLKTHILLNNMLENFLHKDVDVCGYNFCANEFGD